MRLIDTTKLESQGITLEIIAAIIAIGLMTLTAIMTIIIMFFPIPAQNETLVGQGYGSILSLMGLVVGFFYGTSTSSRRDRETIGALADTAKQAQKTLSETTPTSGAASIKLEPGETATARATESGTIIEGDSNAQTDR